MGSNTLIVKEYLESLKEDMELDYLFPILLSLMGFKIIATAKESKGQPQYGKDIIAVGFDEDRIRKRFYFELKGFDDKDINDSVLMKRDGIMESLKAAKYTAFDDSSIYGFNELQKKIVLVHNGVLKNNTRHTFEGFIKEEFPSGNFDRWDIYKLTDLFSNYMFGEYLLVDDESNRLFKRTLVLLDAPDNDFSDFKQLIILQLEKIVKIKTRAFKKFFATMNLLGVVIVHYSKENTNLQPAKECLSFLLLKIWYWILKNKFEKKKEVIEQYKKLLQIQFDLLKSYFDKTLPVALMKDGLYAERGGPFESIGYPIRAFNYINDLIYYFQLSFFWNETELKLDSKQLFDLRINQKRILKNVVNNNQGCEKLLLDNQSIAIENIFLFYLNHKDFTTEDVEFLGDYLFNLFDNLLITYRKHKRFPELYSNMNSLVEFATSGTKPYGYEDRSSLLITLLFELIALLNAEFMYNQFRKEFHQKINLQTADSTLSDEELELILFEKNLYDNYHVETDIDLPESFSEYRETLIKKTINKRLYKTDLVGFSFLRNLAHIYFKNEYLPEELRALFSSS